MAVGAVPGSLSVMTVQRKHGSSKEETNKKTIQNIEGTCIMWKRMRPKENKKRVCLGTGHDVPKDRDGKLF